MVLSNYELIEKIAEAAQAAIYKAYHKKNPGRLLVLKILKAGSLSEYKQAQFRQKIEHLKVLNDPAVITPVSFGEKDGVCFITQDYFEGVTLDSLTDIHSRSSLNDFFTIACRLAGALDKVHDAGIIHGGVKPHNILVDVRTLDVRLIDFFSAVDVRDVSHFIYDRSFVRDTLAYTSPEQTGRINHRVVFASDLYSLGVVFYEMLTGRLPFYSDDPLELIHAHLAKEAPKVHELNPNIPVALSKIVAKLMLKQPEKRYQSSSALLTDLMRCRDEFSAIGTIREFPLESRFLTQRVTFISKMVGRDKEAETILEEYEEVARGNSERLLTQLLDHAKTDLDKAECLAEQTTSLSSIGNFINAIETANRGLAYFNKAIPESPDEADNRRSELMSEIASKNVDVWDTILNMPFTNDRKSKIELAFYSELIPDLYMSGLVPQLYLSAAQSTQHCLSGGMDESVIYSFSIMGLQLGEQEEFEQAFKYEDLARDLSAKYPNTFGATRGMNGIVWCNMHSRSHPREIVDYCLKSIQSGKNCGDLYNAGLSYGPLMWNLQVQGSDMMIIDDVAKECLQFSNRYHLSFSVGLAEAMQAGWTTPMKKDYAPVSMEEKLRKWERDNHIASAGSYYVHMALMHYYFGEYEEAERYMAGVRRYLSGLTDNVLKRQWHVFRVLNALKLYERGTGFKSKDKLLAEIRPIIKKVETWAGMGPLLKPYLAFLYAELERVTGEFKTARGLYLDAINLAHKQKYIFLEGHLNECLGELFLQAGQSSERVYFVEAERLYRKCRAERKELTLRLLPAGNQAVKDDRDTLLGKPAGRCGIYL